MLGLAKACPREGGGRGARLDRICIRITPCEESFLSRVIARLDRANRSGDIRCDGAQQNCADQDWIGVRVVCHRDAVPDRVARSSRAMTGKGKAILSPALILMRMRSNRAPRFRKGRYDGGKWMVWSSPDWPGRSTGGSKHSRHMRLLTS